MERGKKKKENIMLQIVQETVISIFGEFFFSFLLLLLFV
jgi:hypothetical protein